MFFKNIGTLAIITTLLSGCGWVDRTIAHFTGYSEICISHVTYIQFTSGATVKVDLSGKPVECR
jgi:hypothetical protein